MTTRRGNGEGATPDARYQELIDAAADALDAEDPTAALEAASAAMARDPMLPDAHFHAGLALLDLGRHREAHTAFGEALGLHPGDPELMTYEAATRFILGDDAGAEGRLRRVVETVPDLAEAWYWLSLVVERRGDYDEADTMLLRAVAIDPESYHPPYRIERDDLDTVLRAILIELPDSVRQAVQELPIVIQDLPTRAMLEGHEDDLAPDLFGLFTGPSLAEASVFDAGAEQSAVYIFQRNLERSATCREHLLEEARITLVHEIGHYLGLEEDDLESRDLA